VGQLLTATLPAVVAGTPVTQVIAAIPKHQGTDNYFIRSTLSTPSAISDPGGTNFATVTVSQYRAGVKVQDVAQLVLTGNPVTALNTVRLPVIATTPSGGQPDDVLVVAVTHTGTGSALPAGCVVGVELD
jgi:hypothetical protein